MPGQRRVVGDERRSGPGVGTDAFVGDAAVREAEYGRGMAEVVDGDAVAAAAAASEVCQSKPTGVMPEIRHDPPRLGRVASNMPVGGLGVFDLTSSQNTA